MCLLAATANITEIPGNATRGRDEGESPYWGHGEVMAAAVNASLGSVLTILTIAAQIMVFYVVSKDARLRHPNHYFITSLALADVMISIVVMPLWTLQSSLGRWPLGGMACALWNVADYSFCAVSINTICYIATDRYLCLTFPLHYPARRSGFVARAALSAIWVASLLFYSLFIGVTQFTYNDDGDFRSHDCQAHYTVDVAMAAALTTCLLWLPMAYTLVIYVLIFRIAHRVSSSAVAFPQQLASVSHRVADSSVMSEGTVGSNGRASFSSDCIDSNGVSPLSGSTGNIASKTRRRMQLHLKAIRTIGLLWLTFSLCWSPVGVAVIYNALWPGTASPWFLISGYWLAYLNSLLNPLCYAVGNPQFRETMMRRVFRKTIK